MSGRRLSPRRSPSGGRAAALTLTLFLAASHSQGVAQERTMELADLGREVGLSDLEDFAGRPARRACHQSHGLRGQPVRTDPGARGGQDG